MKNIETFGLPLEILGNDVRRVNDDIKDKIFETQWETQRNINNFLMLVRIEYDS